MSALLVSLLLAPPVSVETWAGHHLVLGDRRAPIIGKMQTRTDTFVIARVTRQGSSLLLEQQTCRLQFSSKRVRVAMPDRGLQAVPRARMRFEPARPGLLNGRWYYGWQRADHDGDGLPGITIGISAPLCSGALAVGSETWSTAQAWPAGKGLAGNVRVRHIQRVHKARGLCLKLFSSDIDEEMQGRFAFVPVAPNATCSQLLARPWPVAVKP